MSTLNFIKLDPVHLNTIHALAKEIGCPVEEVNNIYTSALENLKSKARIQDYLIVLTGKKVRDGLRH